MLSSLYLAGSWDVLKKLFALSNWVWSIYFTRYPVLSCEQNKIILLYYLWLYYSWISKITDKLRCAFTANSPTIILFKVTMRILPDDICWL
jgi:hypothetical protein